MAYAIPMIEPQTHRRTTAYTGISWTCLFFGPFPALYRGHVLGFVGMSLMNIATLGFSLPVFIFVYNTWHFHSLLAQGFRPARQEFGETTEAMIRMSAGDNDNLDEIFEGRKPPMSRKFRLATPKLSESLIDDARQEPSFRK
ncbi:MAG: hypothetical protein WDZ54_08020 [Sneathiella sp.]